jgi:hypothetical protein
MGVKSSVGQSLGDLVVGTKTRFHIGSEEHCIVEVLGGGESPSDLVGRFLGDMVVETHRDKFPYQIGVKRMRVQHWRVNGMIS